MNLAYSNESPVGRLGANPRIYAYNIVNDSISPTLSTSPFFTTGNILGLTATLVIFFSLLMLFVACVSHTLKKKLKLHMAQQNAAHLRDVRVISNGTNLVIIPAEGPPSYEDALSSPKLTKRGSTNTLKIDEDETILPTYEDASTKFYRYPKRLFNKVLNRRGTGAGNTTPTNTTANSSQTNIVAMNPVESSIVIDGENSLHSDQQPNLPKNSCDNDNINSSTSLQGSNNAPALGVRAQPIFTISQRPQIICAETLQNNPDNLGMALPLPKSLSERLSTSSFPLCDHQYRHFVRKHKSIVKQIIENQSQKIQDQLI